MEREFQTTFATRNKIKNKLIVYFPDPLVTKLEMDAKIAEIEKKILLELQIKEGAEFIRSKLNNPSHVEQAKISLNESLKRLDFLKAELKRLRSSQQACGLSDETLLNESEDSSQDVTKSIEEISLGKQILQ